MRATIGRIVHARRVQDGAHLPAVVVEEAKANDVLELLTLSVFTPNGVITLKRIPRLDSEGLPPDDGPVDDEWEWLWPPRAA